MFIFHHPATTSDQITVAQANHRPRHDLSSRFRTFFIAVTPNAINHAITRNPDTFVILLFESASRFD